MGPSRNNNGEERDSDTRALSKAEFWQRAAAFSFGAWALVLPIAAGMVIASVSKFTDRFDNYILTTERRITQIEERQARVLKLLEEHAQALRDHDNRLDQMDREITRDKAIDRQQPRNNR